jgi:hypothetical protein
VIALASIEPARRLWQLHQQLLAEQAAMERNLPRWLNGTIVLVGARVGLTSLTTVHRVVLSPGEEIQWPLLTRDLRKWVCANKRVTVRDGASYNFEYLEPTDRFITKITVDSCP